MVGTQVTFGSGVPSRRLHGRSVSGEWKSDLFFCVQAIQMGVQGARGVANKAQEKRERDNLHKTAMNKRQYVDWEGETF